MTPAPDAVYRKTALGQDELKSRRHGLNPRTRQLLILADGRRRVEELTRLLPGPELQANLSLLDEGGFIELVVPGATTDEAPIDPQAFARVRQRIVRALLDSVGPSGDEFAIRIERCSSTAELNELLPAAMSIVEAIRGRAASREFAARIGFQADDESGPATGAGAG
ncbi:MAG: hypothetical protein KJZ83_00935 [Burkholderiaceae bacterium]|nr:hypothetical protein [Burkholderiaceae bacterium]